MRLAYFNLTQGNRLGTDYIIKNLGWQKGISIIGQLKFREVFDNPFKQINKINRPSQNEKLSQQQMAPMVILYGLLLEDGMSKDEALQF